MKTFIFAGSIEEADGYRNRNCLFGAEMLLSDYPLISPRVCEVHLVGTYKSNPVWESVKTRLEVLRSLDCVQVYIEEWGRD